MLHFQSFSLVGFLQEFVPSPADLITAKYCQQDRTYGHDIVGHQEIPEVQPGRSRRKGLKMDHAEAQRRCQCQQKRSHTADDTSKNDYVLENLNILEDGEVQYMQDGQVVSHKGIDVSKHQGNIDWTKVAADGVEFAFIRVGLRGYGTEGKLVEDEYFEQNVKGALQAGIKVGVYFYSQAITDEELLEEANLVLEKVKPYNIELPIVFDVEKVSGGKGRANELSVEERTRLTALFCQTIQDAGYKPMIYHNMEMGTLMLDLGQLEQYDKWFAYYNDDLYYPYAYKVWQYSEKGAVDGINEEVDLNIWFGDF